MTAHVLIGCAAGAIVVLLGLRARTRVLPARAGAARARPSRSFPARRRRATGSPTDLDVAAWCDDLARSVRSGSSLAGAVRESDTDHPLLEAAVRPITRQIARGKSLSAAVHDSCVEPSTALGLAFTVLRSCAELGGPAASPLERVAATLRDRDAIRQEQLSHSAQARMSARVMTLIPLGMLGLLASTDPNVRAAVGTAAGLTTVTVGAALNVAGWCWMQRIIGGPR